MSKTHKIAFRADGGPYVVHGVQVPEISWEGTLGEALAFLKLQWALGTAVAAELRKARWGFDIGHTWGLSVVSPHFRTPHHKRWELLRYGLPGNLLSNPDFIATEHFWQYVLEAVCGQASGLGTMIERGLVSIRMVEGLGGKYSEVFGHRSNSEYIPGIEFRWPHPACALPSYAFREVALSEEPEIIEGWRP